MGNTNHQSDRINARTSNKTTRKNKSKVIILWTVCRSYFKFGQLDSSASTEAEQTRGSRTIYFILFFDEWKETK